MVRRSVERFDTATKTWTCVADMSLCRRNAGKELIVALARTIHILVIVFYLILKIHVSVACDFLKIIMYYFSYSKFS